MKKCNCTVCGKELIKLGPFEENIDGIIEFWYEFWCDDCNISIDVIHAKNEVVKE